MTLSVGSEAPRVAARRLRLAPSPQRELGKISTLAAATLRELGFQRATALDGGMAAWRESGNAVELTVEQPSGG